MTLGDIIDDEKWVSKAPPCPRTALANVKCAFHKRGPGMYVPTLTLLAPHKKGSSDPGSELP